LKTLRVVSVCAETWPEGRTDMAAKSVAVGESLIMMIASVECLSDTCVAARSLSRRGQSVNDLTGRA